MRKSTMNEDIKKYPVFLYIKGRLVKTERINSTADYNHYTHNLHHYIPKRQYDKKPEWYISRGIEQKLILVPIAMHEQIHEQAISNLDDDDFYGWYGIDRWELIFNRKYRRLNFVGGCGYHGENLCYIEKVGKQKAGALLDGKEYKEMPRNIRSRK